MTSCPESVESRSTHANEAATAARYGPELALRESSIGEVTGTAFTFPC